MKYLLLTSSLLVDRVFLHTNLIQTLSQSGEVEIWSTSAENEQYLDIWKQVNAFVKPLPPVRSFREVPHNYLRRLNEFVWDYRLPSSSRISIAKHVRNRKQRLSIRALKMPAKVLAMFKTEQILEDNLEKFLLNYPRAVEAEEQFQHYRPSVLVTTGPFQFEQPAISAAAKKMKIPTLAYIPSWDNVTTKNRMVFKYDGYLVWSEQIKKELHEFYPFTKNKPVYVVGAPQFDIFFQPEFQISREDFCRRQNLNPKLPIIVYAIGSPNFLKEHHGAIELAKRIVRGELGKVQMLVRPHPIHDNAEFKGLFQEFAPHVRLQETANQGNLLTKRSQDEDQIIEWLNTFKHADVVVNLSSTVTVDAAIFDTPIVNLDFDPQPNRTDEELIKDINHSWRHFKPIAESGGVWLVNNFNEMTNAVRNYLKNPSLHHAKRKWIAEYVCGFLDGKCGERMAIAISDFVNKHCRESKFAKQDCAFNQFKTPSEFTKQSVLKSN